MKKRAFTLIELLVVISIIAVLMAIMMPALRKAREQAQSAICQSRHKQLSTGIMLYATENSGYFPVNPGSINGKNYYYHNLISEYMGSEKKSAGDIARHGASDNYIFRCPTQDYITKGLRELSETAANWNTAFVSPRTGISYHGVGTQLGMYGYNRFLTGTNAFSSLTGMSDKNSHPLSQWKTSDVRNSSSMPILACSNVELGYAGTSDYDGNTSGAGGIMRIGYPNPIAFDYGWPRPGRGSPPISWGGPAAIHNGVMMYSMADGSVQRHRNFWPFNKENPIENVTRYFHPIGQDAK